MDREPAFVHDIDIGDRAASVINVELGKGLAVVAICSALCGISAVFAGWAAYQAAYATKRADLLQYYVLEMDAKLIARGIKTEKEAVSARLPYDADSSPTKK